MALRSLDRAGLGRLVAAGAALLVVGVVGVLPFGGFSDRGLSFDVATYFVPFSGSIMPTDVDSHLGFARHSPLGACRPADEK